MRFFMTNETLPPHRLLPLNNTKPECQPDRDFKSLSELLTASAQSNRVVLKDIKPTWTDNQTNVI